MILYFLAINIYIFAGFTLCKVRELLFDFGNIKDVINYINADSNNR